MWIGYCIYNFTGASLLGVRRIGLSYRWNEFPCKLGTSKLFAHLLDKSTPTGAGFGHLFIKNLAVDESYIQTVVKDMHWPPPASCFHRMLSRHLIQYINSIFSAIVKQNDVWLFLGVTFFWGSYIWMKSTQKTYRFRSLALACRCSYSS